MKKFEVKSVMSPCHAKPVPRSELMDATHSSQHDASRHASYEQRFSQRESDFQNGRDLSRNTDKQRGMSLKKN